jgi:hypothetical protein
MCDVCVLAMEARIRDDGRLRTVGRVGAGVTAPTRFRSHGPRGWALLARPTMALVRLAAGLQFGTAAASSDAESTRTGVLASEVPVRQAM